MLRSRALVGAVGLPLILLVVGIGGWSVFALVTLVGLVGIYELRSLSERIGLSVCWPVAVLATLLLIADQQWTALGLGPLAVGGALLAGFTWAVHQGVEPRRAVVGGMATLAVPLYLGVPLGLALALRSREESLGVTLSLGAVDVSRGVLWLSFALLVIWACDVAAYFAGRGLGRRPFFPHVSPHKTVEGTVGGLSAAGLVGLALSPALALSPLAGLALGLATGGAGIFGDLVESLLKRAAGAKDSGRLFPGHGGMLDRIDSLLFAFVMVYYGGLLARALGG